MVTGHSAQRGSRRSMKIICNMFNDSGSITISRAYQHCPVDRAAGRDVDV